MKKNIFAFIGSPLKEKSNTAALARMMLDDLGEKDPEIQYELLTAGQTRLEFCAGCWACMRKGACPLDARDDMAGLKRKMLDADLIVFGSPVYTMSVTGRMKNFLDRLAAWYHTIRLAGKPGVSVSTTAGSGLEQVHELLEMLMSALGVKVVARLETRAFTPGMFADKDAAQAAARAAAEKVYPYLTGEKQVESDPNMEEAFKVMKQKSVQGRQWLPGDYEYWEKAGMLDCDSYAELLNRVRAKKR